MVIDIVYHHLGLLTLPYFWSLANEYISQHYKFIPLSTREKDKNCGYVRSIYFHYTKTKLNDVVR